MPMVVMVSWLAVVVCGWLFGGLRFIINVPGVFPLVWKGVKPWLDVKTTAKIKIFAKVRGQPS